MSTEPNSNSALRSSVLSGPDQIGSDGRRMSNGDRDGNIEAGFRKTLDDGLAVRRELSPSDNVRVQSSYRMPRRPLNGAPPLHEW